MLNFGVPKETEFRGGFREGHREKEKMRKKSSSGRWKMAGEVRNKK